MTFHARLQRRIRHYRLERRLTLLRTARQKLMRAAAEQKIGPRADAIADLAAYADIVAAYLWPVWRRM